MHVVNDAINSANLLISPMNAGGYFLELEWTTPLLRDLNSAVCSVNVMCCSLFTYLFSST